jgi:hypothetical protein
MFIDLHIELSSLIDFYNEEKKGNYVPFEPKEILEAAKKAVLNANKLPFLFASQSEETYYKKYAKLESEPDDAYVPDFFLESGDFYDINEVLYVQNNLENKYFSKLFILKILHLQKNDPDYINKFLDFQLYDNFFGDREYLLYFLQELPAIAPDFPQLAAISGNWNQQKEQIKTEKPDPKKDWETFLLGKKNYRIPGKLTDKQIKDFFEFLCEKKNGEESYLQKEELDTIFLNGFVIPESPLEIKFKLNYNSKRVKKVVEAGIYKLYTEHSYTFDNKEDFVLFFAHFIDDFASALNSNHELENIKSNMVGRQSKRCPMNWEKYLPE